MRNLLRFQIFYLNKKNSATFKQIAELNNTLFKTITNLDK